MQSKNIYLLLLSVFFAISCTVGEKYNGNNSNNTNNSNNSNNVNNTNNTNNTNNVNTDIPTSLVKGFWRIHSADLVMDTVSGTQVVTLTTTPSSVVNTNGDEHFYNLAGNFVFNASDDNNGTLISHFYMIEDNFITSDVVTPSTLTAVVSTEDQVNFSMQVTDTNGGVVTYAIDRGSSTLELNFVSSSDGSDYTGPTKLVYDYVGASANIFKDSGNVNNMLVSQSDDSTVLLTDATYVAMNDGYYYQIASTWASDEQGKYDWGYAWNYSSDGETLENTRSESRTGFLSTDGLGNYSFYFNFYDSNTTTRKVTWNASSVDNGDGTFSFTVTSCYDTSSGETDFSCKDNWPLSFLIQ